MAQKKLLSTVYHPVEIPLPCNSTMIDFKHHCFPGLNLTAMEHIAVNSSNEAFKLYGRPTFIAKKPLPCLCSEPVLRSSNEDPALTLVKRKHIWSRRKKQILELIHRKYQRKSNQLINSLKLNKARESTKLPYGITRLANHLAKNPDKNFKGLYNWYFDSAITSIRTSEYTYLLHAGGELLDRLYLSSIEPHDNSHSISVASVKYSLPFEGNGPIFDVITSWKNDRIGVRQRNCCTFFSFEKDCDIYTLANKSFSIKSGNYAFVSADIQKHKICTVDANRQVKLWSVSQRCCIAESSLPKSDAFLADKFVRVKFSKNSTSIAVIDRKNIYFFDSRLGLDQPCMQWACENYVEKCENMSLIASSVKDKYHYIGTSHSCLLLDNRSGFVQKWCHMLSQTPAVGHSLKIETDNASLGEALIVGSQSSNDVAAICNNWSSESSVSCFPFSLPNRIDTLHEARSNGVLYHPVLQNKFDFSVIGFTSCDDASRNPTLYSLISAGDIFQQKLEPAEQDLIHTQSNCFSKKHLSYLKNWEDNLIKTFTGRNKPHQVVTHTIKMPDLFSKLEAVEIPEWKSKEVNIKKIQKFSRRDLESYTDFLAPHLLNDYGLLNDSDWEDGEDDALDISTRSIGKVHNWLRMHDNEFSVEVCDVSGLTDNHEDGDKTSDSNRDISEDDTSVLSVELSDEEL